VAMQAALVKAVPAAARPLAKLNALRGRPTTWWAKTVTRVRAVVRPRGARARRRRSLRVRSSSASRDGPGESDPDLDPPGSTGLVGVGVAA
jgi:hypothetical protein